MKASLEEDLLKVDYIRNKCRERESYAQNLYAALCNNRFFKNDEEWTCSWRFAGGLVADLITDDLASDIIRDHTDYMNWYCSGMWANSDNNYVPEGEVTSEISNDLLNLGWVHKPYEPRLKPGLYRNEWK
jgi:hypothetical protein